MKSSYKKLGKYIQPVNIRNTDLKVETLLGVSIQKKFIQSIANTIGTNMKNYKIVEKNQFAYGPVTSRNGDKISVALLKNFDKAIVSQAYTVFKVIDIKELLPEYLMMWFMRPEFDRYARFKSHGSARETFDWDEMSEVELPIPSPEKQQEIVNEYNTVVDKIKLNEQLNIKLEETAQALYKHWFVDFEFPNEEGKPYKSSGGKMVYNEALDKEIPEGWGIEPLENIINIFDGARIPLSGDQRQKIQGEYPYYGAASIMDYINDYIFDGTYILLGEDGTVINKNGTPVLQYVWGKFWVNNHAHVLNSNCKFSEEAIYMLLKNTNVTEIITGGVQLKINQTNLKSLNILKIPTRYKLNYSKKIDSVFKRVRLISNQNRKLNELLEILLGKMTKN